MPKSVDFIVKIPHSIYKQNLVSDTELLVYLITKPKISSMTYTKDIYICINELEISYGKFSRKFKEQIIEGMNGLIEKQIIRGEEITADSWVIHKLEEKEEYFVTIKYSDICTIMESNIRKKGVLFRYLCWIIGSRNNRSGIGNQKLSYFSTSMNCSIRTIIRYNEILSELKIIYIRQSTVVKNGEKLLDVNVYGLYEDREKIDAYVNQGAKKDKYTDKEKRSLGAKYRIMCRNEPDYYSIEEKKKIYAYIRWHNRKEKEKYELNNEYIPNLKDEEIFKKML